MNMCTKRCNFTGNLPPITNAPKLGKLLLWGNKLSGNIPNSISNASILKILSLAHNLFSGPILKTLGNLRHLEWFQISNNNLISGSTTDQEWIFLSSLANCWNLGFIDVSGNPLSGVLPTYKWNLSKSLQYFYASNCELQGVIPKEIEGAFRSFDIECAAMRNIVHRNIVKVITCCSSVDFKALVLDYMCNGNIEKWLHSKNCFLDIIQRVDIMIDVATAIEHLHDGHPTPIIHSDLKPSNILLNKDMVAHVGDFGISNFLGKALFIPCSVVCLAMTVRNLNSDQFALLEFKDSIAGPQNVLANNWTASTSVCNWIGVSCGIIHKRVIALNLTSMNLRGTIPPHLGNLSFLLSLDLSSNHFYGHLPKELGQLHRLRILRLSYNRLNGEIPSWLGNLQRVRRLNMKNNNFIGTIPETLVNMSNLEILSLGFNQLSGQVPSSIFKISSLKAIRLSSNSLSGSLPNDTCQHLPKLEVIYLSWNELCDNIP
ncbi:hypothetical protein PVK06_017897 [Gossypium arboreum]|uniref:Protein kinase domain-containing protein n=1 Tax=Gossypium arboreum TaxID=29729 RepID=A0ABR0Q495_GOSAR|nr:hypothetical protein PVK06_017897 [Gossypium arboreum]